MPQSFFVPGPVPIFAGIGGNLSARVPKFIGWTEGDLSVQIHTAKSPVYTQPMGNAHPADETFQGQIAYISGILNMMDYANMEAILSTPDSYIPGTLTRGTNNADEVGTLYLTEGWTYPLYLPFPPAIGGRFTAMRRGYRFWACSLESPTSDTLGTKEEQIGVVWKAMRAWMPDGSNPLYGYHLAENGASLSESVKLYDEDISAVLNLPPLV